MRRCTVTFWTRIEWSTKFYAKSINIVVGVAAGGLAECAVEVDLEGAVGLLLGEELGVEVCVEVVCALGSGLEVLDLLRLLLEGLLEDVLLPAQLDDLQ